MTAVGGMTVGRSLALLSLYCVVPTGSGRSFGAGGASRTGRTTPCEGCNRPDFGGGAVVPASGTAACASEVAAGPGILQSRPRRPFSNNTEGTEVWRQVNMKAQ